MVLWVFAAFLVAHGLVHIAVWGSKATAQAQGSDPDHSWLLGDQHSVATSLMAIATALFVVAGVALLFGAEWWSAVALAGAGASLALVGLFPAAIVGPWVAAPVLIDLLIVAGIAGFGWFGESQLGT
jgi:hypothetical protein